MPSSILPSWLSLSTPYLKTSDIHILDLTMTVQLLKQSTFVHAVVSGALLGNPDIVGVLALYLGCTEKRFIPVTCAPLFNDRTVSCQQNQHMLSWSWRLQALIKLSKQRAATDLWDKINLYSECELLS